MPNVTLELSEETIDALVAVLDLALDDRENYLADGDLRQDYGDELETVVRLEINRFLEMAALYSRLGLNTSRWFALVENYRVLLANA
jgi:hypothetical protein